MKMKFFLMIVVLGFSLGCGQKQEVQGPSTTYLNLDFEDFNSIGFVKLWGTWADGYIVQEDRKEVYSGQASLSIKGQKTAEERGQVFGIFPINEARGKKFTLTGKIKTHNVSVGYAGLWCEVRKENTESLAFANMKEQGCTGTTPWKEYTIQLEIPGEAAIVEFGVELAGSGKAWFDALKITLDGQPYQQVKPKPVVPTKSDLAWIRRNAIPFKSSDPTASHKELEPLKKMIGNRHIVALGEATHGTREFFQMKDRLTRFLAEEKGFTVFAMEAHMAEAELVNRYVLTGKGDPKKTLSNFLFWGWDSSEVLAMIEWMREYNQSGKGHIEFYGFDFWYPKETIKAVTAFVQKADPVFARELDRYYRPVLEEIQEFIKHYNSQKVDFDKMYRGAKAVYDHLQANRETYNKSFDAAAVEWIIHYAHLVVQGVECIGYKRDRDQAMAENLIWLMDHLPLGTKAVLWAHNGHVSKNFQNFKSMGHFLHQRFRDDMIVFGFAFHQGEFFARGKNGLSNYKVPASEPGSVEWFLKSSGIPNFILDIRPGGRGETGARWLSRELEFRNIGGGADDYMIEKVNITQDYDALIYFEKTSAANCFRRTKK
jgi:erythromycin esterase